MADKSAKTMEETLSELERNPGETGPMYGEQWVADQNKLRQEKQAQGTFAEPVGVGLADEELKRHFHDLMEIIREPGQSEADALKGFLKQVLEGGSPADKESEKPLEDGENPMHYGRSARAAEEDEEHEDGAKKKAEAAPFEKKEEDDDEDEHEKHKEGAEVLGRLVNIVAKLEKRLSAMEEGNAPVRTGRSAEAERGAARVVEQGKSAVNGVYRRGEAVDGDRAYRMFGSEVLKVLSNTADPHTLNRIKQEAADAMSDMQVGVLPKLNHPQLQEIAEKIGMKYTSASGSLALGGSE